MANTQRAVFLDRDGVLNQEVGYIHALEDLNLIPGVAEAVRRLNQANLFCCLVTNQSGPARSYYGIDHVDALHQRLTHLLAVEAGARLDAIYCCPYLSPSAGGVNPEFTRWSTWRKPNTGMLVAAAWDHHLDLQQSFMVGDKATDVDMARNAGCRGILVQTGYGDRVLSGDYQHHAQPDYIARDLADAVGWILADESL
ncbi:HAD family hydrolase [Desertifilum sp. FACHB-1129]|uniref:D,D-heptose 1,7-bisphosphate phosphatase n=1 Tax=Desertifilum tharense IPPAS B-1220 TaxID=1781255 RepID=A0A1E5QNM0_9CYAN|nr:HAD family hydrolase [Desertifilum tharense]MBD2312775.1 HAD family hydrolase [Desertifilum sp. FACHB-1129]MBD2324139.1 HAD family hydrolase [Desertifilum sp. FACHB-866]MBD2334153.1 HAD family hydrolase [Desertifilum sp. FACHB-868]MCD8489544.1 HAD family hydrolase [Desertifilum sp.]MDA0212196.1 HAD family hydrolase [Cyanobacteria bacterium FC1]MDL5052918.1 HAD family hydrolase [Oscillatoria laete-virens NRMC-F 0139]